MNRLPTILLLLAVFLGACDWDTGIRGNGHIVTVQKPITEFSEISGRGGLRIEWHNGPSSLSITTDENLTEYLDARSDGSGSTCACVNMCARGTESKSWSPVHR